MVALQARVEEASEEQDLDTPDDAVKQMRGSKGAARFRQDVLKDQRVLVNIHWKLKV